MTRRVAELARSKAGWGVFLGLGFERWGFVVGR